jgi:intergrase/recombinase
MSENPENSDKPLFEDISNSHNKSEEVVDETLKAYREALQQEWAEKGDTTNLRQIARNTKEEIAKHVPDYLSVMRGLALGATSESVKYQATKWLLENALLPNGAGAKDTLTELLEEMEENSKKSPTDSN